MEEMFTAAPGARYVAQPQSNPAITVQLNKDKAHFFIAIRHAMFYVIFV